jgi:hypothetical protein
VFVVLGLCALHEKSPILQSLFLFCFSYKAAQRKKEKKELLFLKFFGGNLRAPPESTREKDQVGARRLLPGECDKGKVSLLS